MDDATTPIEAYKDIIDGLVNETRQAGSSRRVAEIGIYSKAPAHAEFNDFIQSLDEAQRALLARMFQDERDGAIHDVLAALTWWVTCRDVGLTFRGKPMPVELSGMGLHGDYVGRRDGWEWPSVDGVEGA
jgi:hypothetical protein